MTTLFAAKPVPVSSGTYPDLIVVRIMVVKGSTLKGACAFLTPSVAAIGYVPPGIMGITNEVENAPIEFEVAV